MKTLFTTIDQVNEYITVDISSNFKTIKPYVFQAQKETTKIIGKTLHSKLIAVVDGSSDDENLKDLLEIVRLPLANFAYFMAIAKLNINVGDAGFTVTETTSLVPASQWRVDEFRESVKSTAYEALEDLIIYLEENKDSFPDWKESAAYSFNKQFFINNADDFNNAIKTEISRLDFLKLKPFIHQIEQSKIKAVTCTKLFDKLKQSIVKQQELYPELLFEYIYPAVCYLAYDRYDKNENIELEGIRYLEELKNHLNSNADNYFEFKESECYNERSNRDYNEDEESSFFNFS